MRDESTLPDLLPSYFAAIHERSRADGLNAV